MANFFSNPLTIFAMLIIAIFVMRALFKSGARSGKGSSNTSTFFHSSGGYDSDSGGGDSGGD